MTENNLVQKTCVFRRIRKGKSGENIMVSLLSLFWTSKDNAKVHVQVRVGQKGKCCFINFTLTLVSSVILTVLAYSRHVNGLHGHAIQPMETHALIWRSTRSSGGMA